MITTQTSSDFSKKSQLPGRVSTQAKPPLLIQKCLLGLLYLLIVGSIGVGYAQNPTNIGGWIPNERVEALAEDANHLYLGGRFTRMFKEGVAGAINNRGTGVQATSTGEVIQGFPKVNGSILVAIPDGNGGWYIGGGFTEVGGITRNRIAHILPDKSVNPTWNPNTSGTDHALAFLGCDLYVERSIKIISLI